MATDIYRVKSGESLSIIARDFLGDIERWPEIAFINGISYPYFIYQGQVLELPKEKESGIVEVEKPVMLYVSKPRAKTAAAPVTKIAGFSFRPATVILLLVGVALFLTKR